MPRFYWSLLVHIALGWKAKHKEIAILHFLWLPISSDAKQNPDLHRWTQYLAHLPFFSILVWPHSSEDPALSFSQFISASCIDHCLYLYKSGLKISRSFDTSKLPQFVFSGFWHPGFILLEFQGLLLFSWKIKAFPEQVKDDPSKAGLLFWPFDSGYKLWWIQSRICLSCQNSHCFFPVLRNTG